MRAIVQILMALVMMLAVTQPALVSEQVHTDPGIGVVVKETIPPADAPESEASTHQLLPPAAVTPVPPVSGCIPPVQETQPEEGTVDREGEGVTAPPVYAPESFCNPPVEETQPEEGTIDREGEGVVCPPPCEPGPISEEEPQPTEETIALEADPVACPPAEEP